MFRYDFIISYFYGIGTDKCSIMSAMQKSYAAITVAIAHALASAQPVDAASLDSIAALPLPGCEITRSELDNDSGIASVDYVLRPGTGSYIRCTLTLPPAAKWSGRFRGFGNGGAAGNVRRFTAAARAGDAAAHTDMGSSRGMTSHDAVVDFGHRATHLMTVTAKAMTEAYYGRKIRYSYFQGSSTGGGQGIHEAERYPEDYDGIVSGVPANTRLPLHIYFFWNWRQLHDGHRKFLFTQDEFAAVEQAALDWFANRDPPFARGKFVMDPRWTPEAEAGILELAAGRCPSLGSPDKQTRLRNMFRGPSIGGRHIHSGIPFGASISAAYGNQWMLYWWQALHGKSEIQETTDDELLAMEKAWSGDFNACSGNLSAFFARGGKLLVYGGLEDSIVPFPSMVDWYEKAAAIAGGRDKLAENCRLYLIPGRAHGSGRYVKGIADELQLITRWVENGERPDAVALATRAGVKPFELKPYPEYFSTAGNPMPAATPESQGVDSEAVGKWIDVCEKELDALHGFVIARHGKIIAEGTWAPYDTLNRPHMLYSHSKSFTSTAIGFLVDDGKLDLDARVLSFFPDKAPANPSGNLRALRVRDLLTMNVGASYTDPERKDVRGDWEKLFLANDIEKEPGTVFKYDSCATYMLAAIVERVSGRKLMDFLKMRLFEPLGMASPWSTVSPTGVACGGWGMNMTTRDLARFGQLYLNEGVWEGKRILSREWVRLATSRQTWSGAIAVTGEDGSDWHQGYGFQFWRCRHNAFRADGAMGQYTIVMPDQDAVVSINAGLKDMQKEIDTVWKHLLPAFGEKPLPENPAAQKRLADKCASLKLPVQTGSATGAKLPVANANVSKNPLNYTRATLDKTPQGWTLVRPDGFRLAIGDGTWAVTSHTFASSNVEPLFTLVGTRDVAASGAWTAPDVLTVRWHLLGAPQNGTFTVGP